MKEYTKISNVFQFDEKARTIVGMTDLYQSLNNIQWIGTEKVDGTNIRVHWDGHRVTFGGRTDKADIQRELMDYLTDLFCSQEMEYVFEQIFEDKDVTLYGEGYGAKIQSGGDYSPTQKFILFDIEIDDFDTKSYLEEGSHPTGINEDRMRLPTRYDISKFYKRNKRPSSYDKYGNPRFEKGQWRKKSAEKLSSQQFEGAKYLAELLLKSSFN